MVAPWPGYQHALWPSLTAPLMAHPAALGSVRVWRMLCSREHKPCPSSAALDPALITSDSGHTYFSIPCFYISVVSAVSSLVRAQPQQRLGLRAQGMSRLPNPCSTS